MGARGRGLRGPSRNGGELVRKTGEILITSEADKTGSSRESDAWIGSAISQNWGTKQNAQGGWGRKKQGNE